MMPGIPGAGPGLWSGSAEEELARYEAWLTEHAIWSAMTGGQDDDRGGPQLPDAAS